MFCMNCKNEFPRGCLCADRDERIGFLMNKSSHLATRICVNCRKHADLCACDNKDVKLISGGKVFNLPMETP